jgi:MOSC domain-containing protein YiiM
VAEAARLFVAVGRRAPMREMSEVRAVENRGLEGCAHGRPGSARQILLVEEETLVELGLAPGMVRENVTTRGIRLGDVTSGQRLRIGEALLEASGPCEPCARMDEIRMGLQDELQGRRGILCRVVGGALIRRGDAIVLMETAAATRGSGGAT